MKPTTAAPWSIDKMDGVYKCPELKTHPTRQGCMDAYKLPSLQGKTLHYPDGRKEQR